MTSTIDAGICILERWRPDHAGALATEADDPQVFANLRDQFPHPYRIEDAREWITRSAGEQPPRNFAIVVGARVAGGAGFDLYDVETGTAEIGYWLGRSHWGKGIAPAALTALTRYAFSTFDLRRIHAGVYSWNAASCRVLEKAGYRYEGRLRDAIVKRGRRGDLLMYSLLRHELVTGGPPRASDEPGHGPPGGRRPVG